MKLRDNRSIHKYVFKPCMSQTERHLHASLIKWIMNTILLWVISLVDQQFNFRTISLYKKVISYCNYKNFLFDE